MQKIYEQIKFYTPNEYTHSERYNQMIFIGFINCLQVDAARHSWESYDKLFATIILVLFIHRFTPAFRAIKSEADISPTEKYTINCIEVTS